MFALSQLSVILLLEQFHTIQCFLSSLIQMNVWLVTRLASMVGMHDIDI